MLIAEMNSLCRKSIMPLNGLNIIATTLAYRKKFSQLLFLIILCQWVFISPDFEYHSFYFHNAVSQQDQAEPETCIIYDSEENTIRIECEYANLTDVYNQLRDPDLLHKETNNGVWLLNAGIVIEEGATLYVNSTDTSWLKIVADGETAYPIQVSGSLKIDSVKITSWNPNTNDYGLTDDSDRNGEDTTIGTPRPYMTIEAGATGTLDITNSEIAYLGYEAGYGAGRTGLRYEGGDGSIIRGNNIHDLWFALYTKGTGGLVVEDNHVHTNGHYGLDPHTGTHDMIIRNNTVHDNGSTGIICSLDCYNIIIENNKVYNNTKWGIMFSRNMSDSVARNNIVSNELRGIIVSESHNNEVYNNSVSSSGSGIEVNEDSSDNTIYDNLMIDIPDQDDALLIENGAASQNTFYSNILLDSDRNRIDLGENNMHEVSSDVNNNSNND
ncbi:MAG TPA: right-handed parallel beta-helix repeat-containing protein [Nitrososphaeraceae archaeon]|nr:right-handed parallel beta-helix repeat-containing protein [Nitrososphaeraceae archaeon]